MQRLLLRPSIRETPIMLIANSVRRASGGEAEALGELFSINEVEVDRVLPIRLHLAGQARHFGVAVAARQQPALVRPAGHRLEMDRLAASYLIALGARVVREVSDLSRRAEEAGKRLATLAVDTEIRFRSAADRAAFTSELTEAVAALVAKYHDESAPGGRAHRLVAVAHPLPPAPPTQEQ